MFLGIVLLIVFLLVISFLLLLGMIIQKGRQISNPIRKENSDYRFIEVKNEKTRKIFLDNSIKDQE